MKKFNKKIAGVSIITLLIMSISVGCNKNSNDNITTTANSETTLSTEDATSAPAETTTTETTPEVIPEETFADPTYVYDTDLYKKKGIETLTDRALTAIDLSGNPGGEVVVTGEAKTGVYLSWRSMEGDSKNTTFSLYKNGSLLVDSLSVTNYTDPAGKSSDVYSVIGTTDNEAGVKPIDTAVWSNYYQEFTLNPPAPQTHPDGTVVGFTAGDMSLADLDADGQYELVVKWHPDDFKDNSQKGYTGYTFIDGYDINFATGEATQLWRIDLGPNIRSGAHYTQFMVWDMNNDGIAEIACKTADASTTYTMKDGLLIETGYVGACNSSSIDPASTDNPYDYRDHKSSNKTYGYVLKGPEYLTIFNGKTGEIIDTVAYTPERGTVNSWGDNYGNRVDRFLACVAYLDGENPSMVFCRGYYTRVCLTAYQLIDGKLQIQWTYDSDTYLYKLRDEFSANCNETVIKNYQEKYNLDFTDKSEEDINKMVVGRFWTEINSLYKAQGNHNISVADVDSDGKDEIIYGALVFDNDGLPLYSSGLGHGDAQQIGDFLPSRPGLELLNVHETKTVKYQVSLRDAMTGEILFGKFYGSDNGRGVTGDIDPRYEGEEFWSASEKVVYSALSTTDNPIQTANSRPSMNFSLYWDGDLLRELQDYVKRTLNDGTKQNRTNVTKWNYETGREVTLLETSEFLAMVGTSQKMGIVADVIGDWREEIISRHATDNSKIRIYMSTIPTDYVVTCLMQDTLYRTGIAWENVAYNQPVHLSYCLTDGLKTPVIDADSISNKAEIAFSFSKASDGRYGHKVEGYEVYRKTDGDYSLAGTLKYNSLTFTDSNVEPGKKYTYKVAAIVDGKTSYFSFPVEITVE